MSVPRLMNDPDLPEFQRELLRAWSTEHPSRAVRKRVMAFALLAEGAGTVGRTGDVARNARSVSGSSVPKALSAGGPILVKWGGLGAVLVGLTATAAIFARPAAGPAEGAPPVPASQPQPAAASGPVASAAPAPPTATVVASGVVPVSAARPPSSSIPASTLRDEIARLDGVLSAVAAADDPRAVRLADDYERRFPRGTFVQEAEILRIEALVREGKRDAASSAADRFLAAYPSSPHAARLRADTGSAAP